MAAPKGHKKRDWGDFGTSVVFKMKKHGNNSGGSQTPPRRKRRTPAHLKGVPYPGMWTDRSKT